MKRRFIFIVFFGILSQTVCAEIFSAYKNYIYDPNDFAIEVIEYNPVGMAYDWLNSQPFNEPNNALGRPTIDTSGDDWYIPEANDTPVNPVYPAFRSTELVFLGEGGSLVLKFNHYVRDDENNPYGIDFIVFGNAKQVIGNGQGWTNSDPALLFVEPEGFYEPAIVSVSQDGLTWYSFTNDASFMANDSNFIKLPADINDGPFADSFAPTIGRIYTDDPNQAAPNLGQWNQWWAEPTNPTMPVDPNLWFDSFVGYSVAQICQVYGDSAGGTGYDINNLDLPIDSTTGKKWFMYIRIDDKQNGGNADIDAVSDVSSCGDWKHPYPAGDITKNCKVDLVDFAVLANYWMTEIKELNSPADTADLEDDNYIDFDDLIILTDSWLNCSWDCD